MSDYQDSGSIEKSPRTRSAAQQRVARHLGWYIYRAAVGLEEPFDLDQLAEVIRSYVGVKPKKERILDTVSKYYSETQTPLIYRVGHESGITLYMIDTSMFGLEENPFPKPLNRPGRRCKYPKIN